MMMKICSIERPVSVSEPSELEVEANLSVKSSSDDRSDIVEDEPVATAEAVLLNSSSPRLDLTFFSVCTT